MSLGNEHVAWFDAGGRVVEIVGCWDGETPENKYDFYDLLLDGVCINLGEPCYEYPTEEDIRAFLEIRDEMQKG